MLKRRSQLLISGLTGASFGLALLSAQNSVSAEAGDVPNPIRGVVRPQSQATISTDFQAAVSAVKLKEGDRFRKGDLLIEFDIERILKAFFQFAFNGQWLKNAQLSALKVLAIEKPKGQVATF